MAKRKRKTAKRKTASRRADPPPPKPAAPPADQATVDKVAILLVSMQSTAAVRHACAEKLDIPPESVDATIDAALAAIVDAADVDRTKARGLALTCCRDLVERSLRIQDAKTALAAIKEYAKLCGLHLKAGDLAANAAPDNTTDTLAAVVDHLAPAVGMDVDDDPVEMARLAALMIATPPA